MGYGVFNRNFADKNRATTAVFLAEAGFDGIELKGDLKPYQSAAFNAILGGHGLAVLSLAPEPVDLPHDS